MKPTYNTINCNFYSELLKQQKKAFFSTLYVFYSLVAEQRTLVWVAPQKVALAMAVERTMIVVVPEQSPVLVAEQRTLVSVAPQKVVLAMAVERTMIVVQEESPVPSPLEHCSVADIARADEAGSLMDLR